MANSALAAENETLVRSFYDMLATTSGHPTISKFLTQDCSWVNILPETIPFGGVFTGWERIGEYFDRLASGIRIEAFVIDDMVAGHGRVVVFGHEVSLVRRTQKRYSMDWVHVLRVDEGSICSIAEYNEINKMVEAFSGDANLAEG